MGRALLIIDVQNDFTEGGSLGVAGGDAVAAGITRFLAEHRDDYDLVVASRDWHDADNDNGGHIAANPDYVDTWPVHCVAGTPGAEFNPALETAYLDLQVKKGQGKPAYSIFEGTTDDGDVLSTALRSRGVTEVDVVGIATDHCVRASALDALDYGADVRVLSELVVGVGEASSIAALDELSAAGVTITGRRLAPKRASRAPRIGGDPKEHHVRHR